MSQQNPPSGQPWNQQHPQQGGQAGWQPGQYGQSGQQPPSASSGQDGYGPPPQYGQSTPTPPYDAGAQGQQNYFPSAPAGGATGPTEPYGIVDHRQGPPGQYGQPEYPAAAYQQPYGPPANGPYGQPAPFQGQAAWTAPAATQKPRRPVWKTVLGSIFAVIGGLMALSAVSQLATGRTQLNTGSAAYNFGYLIGMVLIVAVPLLLAWLLLRRKP